MAQSKLARRTAVFGSTVLVMLALGGAAWAQPPITETETRKFSAIFSDDLCSRAFYTQTYSGHVVTHSTYFPDTGLMHFHQEVHGELIAVPHVETDPTYTGRFRLSTTESLRAVKGPDQLVEQFTTFDRVVLRGSDGSRVLTTVHVHFRVNANGEATVYFRLVRMVCT
jgi:hypothetical protein